MALNESTGFVYARNGPQSVEAILQDSAIQIRSGPQPANADMPAAGVLLGLITSGGGAWLPGSPANGLRWVRDGRFVLMSPSQTWVLTGIANGVAGHFRIVGNGPDNGGASVTLPRIDGAIALAPDDDSALAVDAQLFLTDLNITASSSSRIGSFWYATPPLE